MFHQALVVITGVHATLCQAAPDNTSEYLQLDTVLLFLVLNIEQTGGWCQQPMDEAVVCKHVGCSTGILNPPCV